MLAASNGHTEVSQMLVEYNACINATNNKHSTALALAVFNGHTQVAELLIENSANVNAMIRHHWSAVLFASTKYTLVAQLLIENSASIYASDKEWTALMPPKLPAQEPVECVEW